MPAGLPTSITVAVEFTAGVWTALTDVVGDSIEIRVGRENAASDIQPGTLSFAVDNVDGKYTPDNPTSSLYPNWVEGKRVRVQTVVSATTYTRFVGRITRIEPDFPTVPWSGRCVVNAVDLLGEIQGVTCRSLIQGLADYTAETIGYYDLTDSNARNGAGESRGLLRDLTVRNVSASGSCDFASDDTFGVEGNSYVTMTSGKGLWHAFPAFSVTEADGFRLGIFVKTTDGSYGELFSLASGRRSSATDYVSVVHNASGIRAEWYVGGALANSSSYSAVDAGWHHLELSYDSGGSAAYMMVDGAAAGGSTHTAPATFTYSTLSIGGSLTMSAACLWLLRVFNNSGYPFLQIMHTGGQSITTIPTAADTLYDLLRLGSKNSNTPLWTSTPSGTTSAIPTKGRSGLEVLIDFARAQSGLLWHEYTSADPQRVRMLALADYRPTTVALTIDADADLDGGPTMSRDNVNRRSSVTASNGSLEIARLDATLDAAGAPDGDSVTSLRDSIESLTALADDLLAAGRDNHLRVSQLTVDLSTAANNLYAAFYAVTPGERVRLSNLPSAYFGVTYMDGGVEGWTERPGVTGYPVTFDLSPADAPSEGIWDATDNGQRWGFGDGVATNVSSATSGATSVQFSWTGGLTLSTSAGDYPLDLDWNGERVTVTSAPAGGSSPQTLTLTRGVAPTVARAHNAGESVDIWNAARWAM